MAMLTTGQASAGLAALEAEQMLILGDAAARLLRVETVQEIIGELFDALAEPLELDIGLHYRSQPGGLGLVASAGLNDEEAQAVSRIDRNGSVCGMVADRREPVHLTHIRASGEALTGSLRELGIDTFACTPLVHRDQLLGTMAFGRRAGPFTASELTLIRTIMSYAATTVYRFDAEERIRRSEERLRQSEARLSAIVANASVGLAEVDLSGRFISVNDELCQMLGRSRDELLSLEVHDVTDLADAATSRAAIRRLRETGRPVSIDKHYVQPDGRRVPVNSKLSLLRTSDRPDTILAVIFDLTRQKADELIVRESELRYRSIFDQAAVGITRSDLEGRFVEVNQRFCEIAGYPAEELVGRSFSSITHPDDLPQALETARRLASGGAAEHAIEQRFVREDGSIVWVRVTVGPVREFSGSPSYYISIVEDVTEQRRAQERAQLLLAELQHRVRNTLAVVRGIARRTAENSETVEDFAMHLDGRLGAFSRTQAYVTRDPSRGVSLGSLVADELAAHGAREGEQVRLEGGEVKLRPEAADKIGLAIHELVTNAIKHGALAAPDGRIEVEWHIESDEQPTLVFNWDEHLPGGGVTKPDSRGFGTDLLQRSLVYEFDADVRLDFTPFGLRCLARVPLANVASAESMAV